MPFLANFKFKAIIKNMIKAKKKTLQESMKYLNLNED